MGKSVDYDNMDSAERAFALFTACEEAGKTSGHDAAKKVWNDWAEPLAKERDQLVADGKWVVSKEDVVALGAFGEMGENTQTVDFLRRADINANSFDFTGSSYVRGNKDKATDVDKSAGSKSVTTISSKYISMVVFIFPGNVSFYKTAFSGSFFFNGAVFKGTAYFDDVGFKDAAYFNSVEFKNDASFVQSDFISHVSLSDVKFHGVSDFTALHSARAFDLSDARFFCEVPQFIQAHFTESPRLDHIQLPVPGFFSGRMPSPDGVNRGSKSSQNDIAAYTALRRLSLSSQDHSTERKAFKGEMRAKRSLSGFSFYWLFSFIYDLLTDFGGSIFRPLMVWFGVFVIAALLYFQSADPYQKVANYQRPEICVVSSNIANASLLSAHNALPFVTAGQRRFIERAYICLYGNGKEVTSAKSLALPAKLGLWGALHTVFSTVLVFFVLLGLRNRFRIR